ncbi:MAG: undecaprenyldiphospho-muramoylpentapeptide beta-N-acetylglucosaminyltransferase [Oceanococcus sp.]
MKLLVMAGGTGGHVFPALAVAQMLREQGVDVLWMGTRNGFEAKAMPAAGIEMAWIDVAGVRGKGLTTLLAAPLQILRAVWQSIRILRRYQPRLVLGMGGYAAGPGGLAAWLLRIPLIIHEQNAAAGTTNRLLSRVATQVLQAYPEAFGARAMTVGNPVRAALTQIAQPQQRGIARHEKPRILILGGSLGALSLNRTVPAALTGLMTQIEVRHQAGRTLATAQQAWLNSGAEMPAGLELVEFIDDMAQALAWADLLICRAGALTLAEVACVGVASILVPFPHAIDDHQTRNAEHLVQAHAAILLPEAQLTAQSLKDAVQGLIDQPQRLRDMAAAARKCGQPNATQVIADQCRPHLGLALNPTTGGAA